METNYNLPNGNVLTIPSSLEEVKSEFLQDPSTVFKAFSRNEGFKLIESCEIAGAGPGYSTYDLRGLHIKKAHSIKINTEQGSFDITNKDIVNMSPGSRTALISRLNPEDYKLFFMR